MSKDFHYGKYSLSAAIICYSKNVELLLLDNPFLFAHLRILSKVSSAHTLCTLLGLSPVHKVRYKVFLKE